MGAVIRGEHSGQAVAIRLAGHGDWAALRITLEEIAGGQALSYEGTRCHGHVCDRPAGPDRRRLAALLWVIQGGGGSPEAHMPPHPAAHQSSYSNSSEFIPLSF